MDETFKHSEYLNLIILVLTGEASSDDSKKLEDWKANDPSNLQFFEEFKLVWENYGSLKDVQKINLDNEWRRFEKYIDKKDTKTIPIENRQKSFLYYFQRVAAIFLIGLIISSIGYFSYKASLNKKVIAGNEIQEVKLNDGTKITLNQNSTIKFPKLFHGNVRKIKLEGEAYFEVAHDSTKPFIIETRKAYIEVLGTTFSVTSFKESNKVEVVVNTGKVSLYSIENPDKKIIIEAGYKGIFDNTSGNLKEIPTNDLNFIAWKTKKLIFFDEPLGKVVLLLNKVYHKNIMIKSEKLKNCPITVTFDNQSFDSILKVISTTIDVTIEQSDEGITISGNGC